MSTLNMILLFCGLYSALDGTPLEEKHKCVQEMIMCTEIISAKHIITTENIAQCMVSRKK